MKTNENSLFRPIERNNNGSVTDECWNDICNIIKDEGIVILPFEHRHGYDVVFSKLDLKLWRYKIDNDLLYTRYCRKSEIDKVFNALYNGNCIDME